MSAEPMSVARIITFAEFAPGWKVIWVSPEANGNVSVLLCDRPHLFQFAPDDGYTMSIEDQDRLSSERGQPATYRACSIDAGGRVDCVHEFAAPASQRLSAHRMPNGGWLIADNQVARILDGSGRERTKFEVNLNGDRQVDRQGRIWCSWGDEEIFSTDGCAQAGIACFDESGHMSFGLNGDRPGRTGAPDVWSGAAMNIVGDDDVWVAYYASWPHDGPYAIDEQYALVRLRYLAVEEVRQWPPRCGNVSLRPPSGFAIADRRILVPGTVERPGDRDPDEHDPRGRLYAVSIDGGEGSAYLPVDEHGRWIGTFESHGRGASLYLTTRTALFVAHLDDSTLLH